MVKIDLRITPTERLLTEEIHSLFTPSLKFEEILERETVFIMGPRGSGKSMVLNYLSTPVQIERLKSNSLIKYDESNLGIYIRCNEHYFGTEKELLDEINRPQESWQRRFTHIFNLTACEIIVKYLESFKEHPLIKINSQEEKDTCTELSEILDFENQYNFNDLRKRIRNEIKNFSKRNDPQLVERNLTINSFLAGVQNILQESIHDFKNRWLVILLDEYHELTEAQQQIISEILSVRKPIFKIATLPLELTTDRQTHDRYIEHTRDFKFVNIGTKNLTPSSDDVSEFKNFLSSMANKRLSNYGYEVEKLLNDPTPSSVTQQDPKSDYAGFESYVVLSSGNTKTFLDLLNYTMSKWTGTGEYIPRSIQQSAVKEFARDMMDGIDFIPAISVYLFRSLILKMGLLFKNYLKDTKRPYLQMGIIDPQNLSENAINILSLAIRRSYLMAPASERYSRGGIKLFSLTLHNSLLPYFDLPLRTHQVFELTAADIEMIIDRRSSIVGTKIHMGGRDVKESQSQETLVPYLSAIHELAEHIQKKELVLFVGSGLSTELGYPTGRELAKKIADHFKIEYVGEDLPTIIERILSKRQRGDVIKFIRSELEKSRVRESKSYKMIVDFNLDEVFTTNWDNSIETEMKTRFPNVEKIVIDGHLLFAGMKTPLIYKIHGDFDHPDMLVITNGDSVTIEKTRPAIINAFKDKLFRKHFLFVGYGMDDLDFQTIFNVIKEMQNKVPLSSYATIVGMDEEKIEILRKKGIIPLPVKGDILINSLHEELKK